MIGTLWQDRWGLFLVVTEAPAKVCNFYNAASWKLLSLDHGWTTYAVVHEHGPRCGKLAIPATGSRELEAYE